MLILNRIYVAWAHSLLIILIHAHTYIGYWQILTFWLLNNQNHLLQLLNLHYQMHQSLLLQRINDCYQITDTVPITNNKRKTSKSTIMQQQNKIKKLIRCTNNI